MYDPTHTELFKTLSVITLRKLLGDRSLPPALLLYFSASLCLFTPDSAAGWPHRTIMDKLRARPEAVSLRHQSLRVPPWLLGLYPRAR